MAKFTESECKLLDEIFKKCSFPSISDFQKEMHNTLESAGKEAVKAIFK